MICSAGYWTVPRSSWDHGISGQHREWGGSYLFFSVSIKPRLQTRIWLFPCVGAAARGALIRVDNLEDAANIVNKMAPEHLELAVSQPEQLLELVQCAGAIFIGNHSAEVVGDYMAGPSHVLPTGGTARFTSPLGVYDFQVRSSIINCSARGSVRLSRDSAILAEEEGLHAHAESARYRVQG